MEALKRTACSLYFPPSRDRWTKTRTMRLLESATQDDNFVAPHQTLLELADMSTWPHEAPIIAQFLTDTLRSPSNEWRRIYKSLHVVEYLLNYGSSTVISHLQSASLEIRYLCDFPNLNGNSEHCEGGKSYSVRVKAKLVYSQIIGTEMKEIKLSSGYDIGKESCFEANGYEPPNASQLSGCQRLNRGEDTVVSSAKPLLRPEIHLVKPQTALPSKSSALFARLANAKTVQPKDIDLLSMDAQSDATSVTKEGSEGLDLLDFTAVERRNEPGKDLLVLEPGIMTEPCQAPPLSPKSPTLPQCHSSPVLPCLPHISHNLAPACQQPSFPLPTKPTSQTPPPLSLDSLVSGLDHLAEETLQARPKKREFVINI